MENILIITKPDKDNRWVTIDKQDYLDKMKVIINNASKVKRLGSVDKFDNTIIWENNTIKFLKYLVLTNEISQDTFDFITPVGSMRTRIYGLPKIYKKAVHSLEPLSYEFLAEFSVSLEHF